jgi:AbrB family looped-hinge helix DNA binding protein
MVKLRLKVGPKGQIIIPKILREKYRIKENDYVFIELRDDELVITRAPSIDETLEWIRLRRKRLKARQAVLGELSEVDLEEEFDEDICGC